MPKTVPASKFQEWKGLDRIGLIVHEMKCIFREITKDDFGLDDGLKVLHPYWLCDALIKSIAELQSSLLLEDCSKHVKVPIVIEPESSWGVGSASRAGFSLEVSLEIRSVINTGTCSQKIHDSRLAFHLRQRRRIVIDACLF